VFTSLYTDGNICTNKLCLTILLFVLLLLTIYESGRNISRVRLKNSVVMVSIKYL